MSTQVHVDKELLLIAREIVEAGYALEEWRALESDDQFQSAHYVGGFDATEDAFCFSFYPAVGRELWFQFSLQESLEIANREIKTLVAREADY